MTNLNLEDALLKWLRHPLLRSRALAQQLMHELSYVDAENLMLAMQYIQ